jgi:DNA repair photolyase
MITSSPGPTPRPASAHISAPLPELWRLIEPGTPPPLKRLQVMKRLSEASVPCGVFLAPILLGITDSVDSIEAVAAAAKEHGAASFGSAVLRLAPLVKEHYLGFVAETFPDLVPRYERAYAGTNIASDYQAAIERRLGRIRERHGFSEDAMQSRRDDARKAVRIAEPESVGVGQLALPLGTWWPWRRILLVVLTTLGLMLPSELPVGALPNWNMPSRDS